MDGFLHLGTIPDSVLTINLAGEQLQNTLVQRLYRQKASLRIVNLYGPSEDTTYSTVALIEKGLEGRPPIGHPIANTQAYVLDDLLQPVPPGIAGELYIGGAGVARGYLHRPELTATRFIPDPFAEKPGLRLYRTGDRVRYRTDDTLEFLGRLDQQVKIRGFRIEPGEIELILERHPAVRQAVVLVREDVAGNPRLVTYVVPEHITEEDHPSIALLRAYIQQSLPAYMTPNIFLFLTAPPLTSNGKLDRKALMAWPLSELEHPQLRASYVAPRTTIEEAMSKIWAEVLGIEQVGIDDNFFELGGHSLLATQVISRIQESLYADIPLRALFERPTISDIALLVAEKNDLPEHDTLPAFDSVSPEEASSLIEHLSVLSDEEIATLFRRMA